jgi:hypothetical protein
MGRTFVRTKPPDKKLQKQLQLKQELSNKLPLEKKSSGTTVIRPKVIRTTVI